MTSHTYFFISGLITHELNSLDLELFKQHGDRASEALEHHKTKCEQAQEQLDKLYRMGVRVAGDCTVPKMLLETYHQNSTVNRAFRSDEAAYQRQLAAVRAFTENNPPVSIQSLMGKANARERAAEACLHFWVPERSVISGGTGSYKCHLCGEYSEYSGMSVSASTQEFAPDWDRRIHGDVPPMTFIFRGFSPKDYLGGQVRKVLGNV